MQTPETSRSVAPIQEIGDPVQHPYSPREQIDVDDLDADYESFSYSINWVKDKIALSGFPTEPWKTEFKSALVRFFQDASMKRLFVFQDAQGLVISPELDHEHSGRLMYLIKDPRLSPENLDSTLTYGVINTNSIDSMLHTMQGSFVPSVLANQSWPESVKKEFTSQLHRFMASLTETAYRIKGSTVLYVPLEDVSDPEAAAKDKELVQRFESALIHWTRQIKEVINEKDNTERSENSGPLAEIEFWRSRTEDLNGIRAQLDREDVRQIKAVLAAARSAYLAPFDKLSSQITSGSTEAQDNLKFLSTLRKPCEELAAAEPKDIAKLLPGILTRIRMIWGISRHFNTPEKLTGLLRKVSNEIINRCCAHISLQQIFDGDVADCIKVLNDSIAAGDSWKAVCKKTLDSLSRRVGSDPSSKEKKWEFEESSIFAEVDAFVQRCRDLLEVCEGQVQFAQKGNDGVFPVFRGSKGPEIVKSLKDIQIEFEKLIRTLRSLNYNILDVKVTRWHDDYGTFKSGVKDLEVMMQNVISSAFETMKSVAVGVELLEAFSFLAKRDAIKRAVEKKTVSVYALFTEELNQVKKEFDHCKRNPPIQPYHPKFAGAAMWVKNLLNRIERDKMLLSRLHFLPSTREAEDANQAYAQLHSAFTEFIKKTYNEWTASMDSNLLSLLETNLIVRSETDQFLLESNFDKTLRKVFEEVRCWEKLHFEVPYAAMDISTHEEKLRVVRENVFLVVRDYNNIILALNSEERRLFEERIQYLSRKISPGLTKFTWATKNAVEFFVRPCRKHCRDVAKIVEVYKESITQINQACKTIGETLLVHIEKKKVYEEGEFEAQQSKFRDKAREKLQQTHNIIVQRMLKIYEYFKHDGEEVQKEWNAFVDKVERKVDEALRQMVKRSLQEMSRAISGNEKTDVQPLFWVYVVLEGNKVAFKPSILQLSQMIKTVSTDLITVITVVPRLGEALEEAKARDALRQLEDGAGDEEEDDEDAESTEEGRTMLSPRGPSKSSAVTTSSTSASANAAAQARAQAAKAKAVSVSRPSFFEVISKEEQIPEAMAKIIAGVSNIEEKVTKYMLRWNGYDRVWELDKDAFIRRFAKTNRPLSAFENEIVRYKDMMVGIINEEAVTPLDFLKVDCSQLKTSLVAHCNMWQQKFFNLLQSNAQQELRSIYDFFSQNTRKMGETPKNLEQLGESINLVAKMQTEVPKIESRFEPLGNQYALLEKYEVHVREDELIQLGNLPAELARFKTTITDAQKFLDKQRETFRVKLLSDMETFGKSVQDLRDDFTSRGPFDSKYTYNQAMDLITDFRNKVAARRDRESQIKQGLAVFSNIEQPVYRELSNVTKDLDMLEQVWQVTADWSKMWDSWKTGKFDVLNVEEMETTAGQFHKRIYKLGKDVRWDALLALKEKTEQFKRMMPLIQDLKNPAIKDRHWNKIKEEIGRDFHVSDLTLQTVFDLQLDTIGEFIGSLSNTASKQLGIEQSLTNIEAVWETMSFDIGVYKSAHRIKGTEEIFTALEDHVVTLGTMKASRFVEDFKDKVEQWERLLSHITECIEMLLQVQRQWMYLENIFVGPEIKKQLPEESKLFERVDNGWKISMSKLNADPNVKRGTHLPNLLENLQSMNTDLELIQKRLDDYLESKRRKFPRFYFLSNDDLLEILGQSRDPQAVQPHLKKCFEAIKSLEIQQKENGRGLQALGMNSPEGEFIRFANAVTIDGGPVEDWLLQVENMMRISLQKALNHALNGAKAAKNKDKWIKEISGQMLITSGQVIWTVECEKALLDAQKGNKNALKLLKKKWMLMLAKYSEMVSQPLAKLERSKLVALITIEVHARDVIDKMAKSECSDLHDFIWLSQLRFYWEKIHEDEDATCVVRQTDSKVLYDYEYLGNSGRLVITPLTDRCYMTLTTAIQLRKGGLPQGPAGTGKTETVKDLGKAIAKYVIVFNCSDGLDYKSLGRMFSGLAQTGAWSCFDEFNRIEVEVLSVVAQQILCILNAIIAGKKTFIFEGNEIKLNPTCGIFVTMNPGYAGRSELPDNLKALLRPISMMVPDSTLIAEIMLFSEGFKDAKPLSKKITTLYSLMIQQLSKQDHYDFGLRNVKAVLNSAGALKRSDPTGDEEKLLLRACRDMNLPKFIAEDVPLFLAMLGDLFPGLEQPEVDYGALQKAILEELEKNGLQPNAHIVRKAIQLYETKQTRHGVMVVGLTGSGKSTSWQSLQRAMTLLKKNGVSGFQAVRPYVLNPKSISMGELYGEFNLDTREWTDGVLSSVMRQVCHDEKPDEKWIVLDGPVDTLWIESMNTVLDDNKLLTLINGERIAMPPQVSLLFEVQDLSVASPATVSRCGMVFFDAKDLGWRPYVETWLTKRESIEKNRMTTIPGMPSPQDVVNTLRSFFEKYVTKLLDFRASKECVELVPIAEINAITSLCSLFDSLATQENGVSVQEPEFYLPMMQLYFVFSCVWSLGASVDEETRKKFDAQVREAEPTFPAKDSVYEYFVDPKTHSWRPWEEKIPQGWKPNLDQPFYKILVPTVDTVRNSFLISTLVRQKKSVLVVGNTGTGKTSIIQSALATSLPDDYTTLTINFSARTSSKKTQEIIESRVEKRTKDTYGPPGGKKLLAFIDDLNMPLKDKFGSQPPLELIRQWLDYGFWYDRAKQTQKSVVDMQLIAAMGPPGGGRSVISQRLQSRFNLLNMTFPSESQIKRIFGTLLSVKFQEMGEEIKSLAEVMTQATIEIYNTVIVNFLPTPSKSHYVFNLRDLSKVFQGLLQADKKFTDHGDQMKRMWVHECFRVFADRLNDDPDREMFRNMVSDKLNGLLGSKWSTLFKSGNTPVFGDFLRTIDSPPYEDISAQRDSGELKKWMEDKLMDYNNEPKSRPMNLVMFRDAIEHVCRIHRVLRQPRGNLLLVGVGGSGRQSLTRLATYIAGYTPFQIEVFKGYKLSDFHNELITLYKQTGLQKTPTVFIFSDTQIVEEGFLEDINGILSSGEVPNLFAPEDLSEIREGVRNEFRSVHPGAQDTPDALFAYFIERVRNNLHVVLCLSPIGEAFRNRLRMFPSLVNSTTIDWFAEWPGDALREVAMRFLEDIDLGGDETKSKVADVFVTVHTSVLNASRRMMLELKRYNYVTPTNYLELVAGYSQLLAEKRTQIGELASKLANGLDKLEDTRKQVQVMSVELEEQKKVVAKSQKECEDVLVVIVAENRAAEEQKAQVETEEAKISKEKEEANKIKAEAQVELDKALPAMQAAEAALNTLQKGDIAEVKNYKVPPQEVQIVLSAVMTVLRKPPTWEDAKREMNDPDFLNKLRRYDKDDINDSLLGKMAKFTVMEQFDPERVQRISFAAHGMCLWVRAMEVYGRIAKEVGPKRERLNRALELLEKKEKALKLAQDQLAEVTERVRQLNVQYTESLNNKNRLKEQADLTEARLSRAEKLIGGLAGERVRWSESIKLYQKDMTNLVGDVLLAAAFLSYAGPFNSEYRSDLVDQTWLREIRKLGVPVSSGFSVSSFLAKPTDVREWNIQGLPADSFSKENGVLVSRGRRWPLMVDPQGQANKWIKNMERSRNLIVMDPKALDFRKLQNAVKFGTPVLLQDIGEEIDPALEPLLSKAIVKGANNRLIIRIGSDDVDYNPDFKFYLTTRLPNPHYTPEVSTKTTIVNFAVKEQGLEDQLLAIVVQRERPDLEERQNELVLSVAAAEKKIAELEDEILRLLTNSKGSLLDDTNLINTLQDSKTTSEQIKQQLTVAEKTKKEIGDARDEYRPAALRASILFFVLNDLSRVDPMYQFALDSYIGLFNMSIEKSPKSDDVPTRIKLLNEWHTASVYRNTCRGLFEKHKLLFAFHMCVKIMQAAKKINMEEYGFFLKGGQVLDKKDQMPNPCPDWLTSDGWDNIFELDKLPNFHGIATSFESLNREWREWFRMPEPEKTALPGEWEGKVNELQRMLVVRCVRPDRVVFMVTSFIVNNMSSKFVEPPVSDLGQTFGDSTPLTPLIFVLSAGVDPTDQLAQLAEQRGINFMTLSLGQGQEETARRMIQTACEKGGWVFLANCHLMISWMPTLEKIVEDLPQRNPNDKFRLWLSSNPHPKFPISILQKGIKMTTEPPRGLRANVLRLYGIMTEAQFTKCRKPEKYKKLLFALCFYHAILLERKKFGSLGMNIPYDFNDSDFRVSEEVLCLYLNEYDATPWEALRYLISEASYGGRVTDEFDRRLLNVYINQYLSEPAVREDHYKLSPLPTYYIPRDGTLLSYKDYVSTLPVLDRPEAFGQHPNADIAAQIDDSETLLDTLTALRPRTGGAGGASGSRESAVLEQCTNLETNIIPEYLDFEATALAKADDPSALNTVLLQEITRYNKLLSVIKRSLADVKKGIKGLIVMSPELDEIYSFISDGKVPPAWQKAYPSTKPLASWTRDLVLRVDQLRKWAEASGPPKVFWLGGFTFPTGFLTAVLQTFARKHNVSIDSLAWDFSVPGLEEKDITAHPKDGVYIKGLVLEGAGWNHDPGHLCDPGPMELLCDMPIMLFKPVEKKNTKTSKAFYSCPLYLYPVRTGTRERPSFMITVDLKTEVDPDVWTKRGTALLLSTSK